MDQRVGLILSTIVHLGAGGKHSGVKCTCSAGAVAFRTKASYLLMVSVLRGIHTFFRGGRGWAGETQQNMEDAQIVAPHATLAARSPAFKKTNACFLFYNMVSIHLSDEALHSARSSHRSSSRGAELLTEAKNQAG